MVLLTTAGSSWQRVRARLKQTMVTGLAVTVPTMVTLLVLGFVVDFLSGTLNPFVTVLESTLGLGGVPDLAVKAVVFLVLVGVIGLVGLVAERQPDDADTENSFDRAMASIPGIGSIYTSFNQMSQLLLESDTESFREVKLVAFPSEGSYSLAFLTAETPDLVADATGHEEMQTLFLPMAPNPVMGGHVITVEKERVFDVDMTVEEGIRAIVTSGVAIEELADERVEGSEVQKRVGDESTV